MPNLWSAVLLVLAYVLTPLCIVWTWIRFVRYGRLRDRSSWLSMTALILTTFSGLLATGAFAFSAATGGFAYYDPRLLRIFKVGLLLSSLGFVTGLIGSAFRNPLRWQVPAASFGMLIFWFLAAVAE